MDVPLMSRRIAVHDYCGHPFQVQLSRELARRGHEVRHYYCASFSTPHGNLVKQAGDPPSFSVRGIGLARAVDKYSPIARLRQDLAYGSLLTRELEEFHPDVVLSANTPLPAQAVVQRHCRKRSTRFVFWLQDLYAEAARRVLAKKLPMVAGLGAGVLHRVEQRLLRQSDAVVAISQDFVTHIEGSGNNVSVVANWAPLPELPMRPRRNAWSGAHGLDDKFCFVYTGTLGFKHNPQLLLELAQRMAVHPEVRVIVISEGMGASWLRERVGERGLTNLMLLDYQPFEVLPDVLSAGEVLVALLESDAGKFSVPSKVLTYLCAGRPLLLSVPLDNLAARTVEGAGAGLVAGPDDAERFYAQAARLYGDANLRQSLGRQARVYAERTFNIEALGAQFERLLVS
jgi:colanic acid biosynthesis glycosyl transferase WcaI